MLVSTSLEDFRERRFTLSAIIENYLTQDVEQNQERHHEVRSRLETFGRLPVDPSTREPMFGSHGRARADV